MDEVEEKTEIERQRQELADLCVGPVWQHVLVVVGELVLPILGLKRTPKTEALMEQCEVEHDIVTGWALLNQDGPPMAYMDLEFVNPLPCHITLSFTAANVGIFSILASNGGKFALALEKNSGAIMIEDMATDVPRIMLAYANAIAK